MAVNQGLRARGRGLSLARYCTDVPDAEEPAEGGGDTDTQLCLTQSSGTPEMGTCGSRGAAQSSCTWILVPNAGSVAL